MGTIVAFLHSDDLQYTIPRFDTQKTNAFHYISRIMNDLEF